MSSLNQPPVPTTILSATPSPAATMAPRSHLSLPRLLTSFVGRERELVEIKALLMTTPLLTLTGAGGSGKTRLALKVADDLKYQFEAGVAWTSLAPLADPTRLPQAIATALHLPEQPGRPLIATLTDYLRPRRLLLVLDNCEHLVTACAQLAHSLLRACPDLRILTTSREALGIAGEHAWPVPPLRPDEAIHLFAERGAAVQPGFGLTEANTPIITQICYRLDGIPLAIELAAARVKVLTVDQIAARLDDVFRLLTGGARTALPRHQTLRAAIDWSYELLTEAERVLLRRLSVFRGGFTLEAAEAVTGDPPSGTSQSRGEQGTVFQASDLSSVTCHLSPEDVLDLLARLVDKSLVLMLRQGDEGRYRMLETVRQYARDRLLEAGEADDIRRRHANAFLHMAETAEPLLRSGEQATWLGRLDVEMDNLRAVLRWASETGEAGIALRLAGALWWFCYLRGNYREGREWLDQALSLSGGASQDRAKALTGAGVLAHLQCEYSRARGLLEEALLLYRALGDPRGVATTLQSLGSVSREQASYADAEAFHTESLALWRMLNERGETARALNYLAFVNWLQGHYEPALALAQETLSLFRQQGDKEGIAWSLINLGAIGYYNDQTARAAAWLDEGEGLAREVGFQEGIAWAMHLAGLAVLRQDDTPRAVRYLRESLAIHWELGDRWRTASVLEALAEAEARQGQADRAACLFGAATALREAIGTPLPPVEQADFDTGWSRARADMGAATFDNLWQMGHALPLDQAIKIAQGEPLLNSDWRMADRSTPPRDNLETLARQQTPSALAPGPQPLAPELRILGFGRSEVYREGRLLVNADWTVAKARELLFFLLSHPPRTREQIGLAFWPDASPSQLRASCRVTIYHLRRALGRPEWVLFEHDHYTFNRELAYTYDVETFEREIKGTLETEGTHATRALSSLRSLEAALQLYRGDYLEDVSAEWAVKRREDLRRLYVEGRLRLGQAYFDQTRFADAAEHYRQALKRHDLESAHRELMRCYARLGEVGQALRHYQTLADRLRDDLKATPAPETQALYERLRRGEAV